MWRFKPFMHKETAGLEGRSIDVGNLKIHVKNAIAEGGFSCVYLARDAVHLSKQYALKHIICNDDEFLELVMKEISVMKLLRGHPNVVTLCGHTIMDMGRTKEAFLVMEFCEQSLVSVLESRGAGFFEEKQVLTIFRDVCNAVFAMHSHSPPIAHRDLKAENLLLGPDGLWKLCDFGSISTNHKRFEKPEEMGIEEDNIRKHTTPAYRAPEMWDLFRRELINEKVDIWALGCLLFRICYFKSAFDGESKLQILNGNYRIPELPKYSLSITDLIRDMLQASPDDRPDITQVWFRVNEQLPVGLQKSLPDRQPEMNSAEKPEGFSRPANKSAAVPLRSPPPPPSVGESARSSTHTSRAGGGGGQLGAFWSTQHADDSLHVEEQPKFDVAVNSFVAEFDTKTHSLGGASNKKSGKEDLQAEVDRLKEQLKQANLEKEEIASKFEKLSAICRSQRQELQELKLSARTPSPNKYVSRNQTSPGIQPSADLLQGKREGNTASPEAKSWQPFVEEPKPLQPSSADNTFKSVRTRSGQQNKQASPVNKGFDSWGFGAESFTAVSTGSTQISRPMGEGNSSQRFGEAKVMDSKPASQPAGWAGF